ncbi:MAG: hypothetical protein KF764_00905 [Labilithrix sp.]|nr:hypothetical protein [Labilithrix sp.]
MTAEAADQFAAARLPGSRASIAFGLNVGCSSRLVCITGDCNLSGFPEIRTTERFAPKGVFVTAIMLLELAGLVLTTTARAMRIVLD